VSVVYAAESSCSICIIESTVFGRRTNLSYEYNVVVSLDS